MVKTSSFWPALKKMNKKRLRAVSARAGVCPWGDPVLRTQKGGEEVGKLFMQLLYIFHSGAGILMLLLQALKLALTYDLFSLFPTFYSQNLNSKLTEQPFPSSPKRQQLMLFPPHSPSAKEKQKLTSLSLLSSVWGTKCQMISLPLSSHPSLSMQVILFTEVSRIQHLPHPCTGWYTFSSR